MKAIRTFRLKILALAAVAAMAVVPARAQSSDTFYANVDWQFNFPLGNDFVKRGSGWGVNLEGGYYLTENLSVGGFLAWHSNHKYVGRQDLAIGDNGILNTDQQHTQFQLPFGAAGRYTFDREGMWQPYVSVKIGPQYARLKSVFNAYQDATNTWGFYVSPEVGINIFPWVYSPGIHVAAYYSYATNKGSVLTYTVDGMSNFGFRVGIAF